jgi:hypothetical protein
LCTLSALACASVPTAPPPIPAGPGDIVSAGALVYDTADPEFFLGGGQTWARLHLGQTLDVGGSLQLTTGYGGQVRFLGGSLLGGARIQLNEGLILGAEITGEYVDAFAYRRVAREPLVMLTVALPVVFQPLPDVWFWTRPALGGAADLRLLSSVAGLQPISSGVWPVWRLSFGAAWEVWSWLKLYGETSTTLPFGGAYLGAGAAIAL